MIKEEEETSKVLRVKKDLMKAEMKTLHLNSFANGTLCQILYLVEISMDVI